MSSFIELRPGRGLDAIVDRVWMLRTHATVATPAGRRIVPDGRVDIVFQLGDPPVGLEGRSCVVGAMRRFVDIRYEGRVDTIGIRFRAGGAASVLDPPIGEFTGRFVPLDGTWRDVGALEDELASAAGPAHRLAIIERALLARLRMTATADPVAELLEGSAGRLSVADLVHSAGIGERQLERRFRERVGLAPRLARRIARFWRAARLLRRRPDTAWQEIAHGIGFYDQSHLIREFRAFAGVTPNQWAANDVGFIQDHDRPESHISPVPERCAVARRTA